MTGRQLLSSKEEIALLERFRAGDDKAGGQIALGYEPLIQSIAAHFYRLNRQFVQKSDLISAGFEGFMMALRNARGVFDHSHGYRLGTYARLWVKNSIASYIRRERWWAPSMPDHVHRQVIKVFAAERKLRNSLGHEPTLSDLANGIAIPLKQLQKLKGWLYSDQPISLSLPTGDGNSSLHEVYPDRWSRSPFFVVADSVCRDGVSASLSTLAPREEKIIRLRFGIGCGREHTVEEIAAEFEIRPETVRRLLNSGIKHMRHDVRKEHLLQLRVELPE